MQPYASEWKLFIFKLRLYCNNSAAELNAPWSKAFRYGERRKMHHDKQNTPWPGTNKKGHQRYPFALEIVLIHYIMLTKTSLYFSALPVLQGHLPTVDYSSFTFLGNCDKFPPPHYLLNNQNKFYFFTIAKYC